MAMNLGDGTSFSNSTNMPVNHCYVNNSSNQMATFDVDLIVISDSGIVSPVKSQSVIHYCVSNSIAKYIALPNPVNIIEPLVYFTNQSQDYTKFWWTFVGTGPFKVDSVQW